MDENNEYAQSCLDAVMEAVWKHDDHDEFCGSANSYKTMDGKVVFLTQAESYHHRGISSLWSDVCSLFSIGI